VGQNSVNTDNVTYKKVAVLTSRPLICSAYAVVFTRSGKPMKKDPYHDNKTVHYADKINPSGGVSALCYALPKRIDLDRATWTISKDQVTCRKCLAKMK